MESLRIVHGLKMTGRRGVTAHAPRQARNHIDAEEVYCRAVAADPRIAIPTVYRTMSLLEEKVTLERRDFGSSRGSEPMLVVTPGQAWCSAR